MRLHTRGLKVLTSRENISAIRNLLGEEQGSSSTNQPMSTTLCRTLGTLKELGRRVHISNLPNLLLSPCCSPATLTLLATFLPSNTESLPWRVPGIMCFHPNLQLSHSDSSDSQFKSCLRRTFWGDVLKLHCGSKITQLY